MGVGYLKHSKTFCVLLLKVEVGKNSNFQNEVGLWPRALDKIPSVFHQICVHLGPISILIHIKVIANPQKRCCTKFRGAASLVSGAQHKTPHFEKLPQKNAMEPKNFNFRAYTPAYHSRKPLLSR